MLDNRLLAGKEYFITLKNGFELKVVPTIDGVVISSKDKVVLSTIVASDRIIGIYQRSLEHESGEK